MSSDRYKGQANGYGLRIPLRLTIMTKQNFVGDQPVEQIPEDAKKKIADEELVKEDIDRLSKKDHQPGAAVRAGVATRDPSEFDTRSGGWGDPKPVKDPIM